jgi:hypothetical protein
VARLKTQLQLDEEHTEAVQKLTGNYPMPTDRDALLYSRYSSAKQVVASIAKGLEQLDGLLQRAIALGWRREQTTPFVENSVAKDGRIKSVSGTKPIESRAKLSTVVEHIKNDNAGALLCDDISRLTRDADLTDAVTLARVCKQHDCLIITNDRIFNFKRSGDYNDYIKEAQEAAAFLEHHIKGKMLRNRQRKADQGKVANGTAPTGLTVVGDSLVPNVHSSGVAWVYQRFVEVGCSRGLLLRELTTMARAGNPLFKVHPDIDPKSMHLEKVFSDGELIGWTIGSRTGLTDMLTNPHYIGHLVFNGVIVKRDAHEAIVNADLWQYCFDRLSLIDLEHRKIERTTTLRYSYPETVQTALLFGCRNDGSPVINGTNGLHVYIQMPVNSYILRTSNPDPIDGDFATSISTKELDSLIEHRLLGMLHLSEVAAPYNDRFDWHKEMVDFDSVAPTSVPDDTLATLESEIALIQQDLKFSSHVMDTTTRTELYEKLARLSQRRDKLQQDEQNKARQQRQLQQAQTDVIHAYDRWQGWDLERRRSFIRLVTESITMEEIASGWLRIDVQWSAVLGGLLDHLYLWRESGTLWTAQELETLQQHYPSAMRADLLRLLPTRSWDAIRFRAMRLKLHRVAKYEPLTIPSNMSISDTAILEQLRCLMAENAVARADRRLYIHTEQPPNRDVRTC